MNPLLFFILFCCSALQACGQMPYVYTRQDTLRGTLSAVRSCYDVCFYDLNVKINIEKKSIEGSNTMYYTATTNFKELQIDLFENMNISRISQDEKRLKFRRDGNATFVKFAKIQKKGNRYAIKIEYSGMPQIATRPPWNGGFVWAKNKSNKPWLGVACQGLGASVWFPNKDHPADEPDSMRIVCQVPQGLFCVANGNLRSQQLLPNGDNQFEWFVGYSINNYNVSLNVADYVHWSDFYTSTDSDTLGMDFYVLKENEEKARQQFKQAKTTLNCLEYYFGKYPFWNDGYALVETSYLGMEHQGAIAYGNGYTNGYLGTDLSKTGIGLKWDYIIVHESGHEYFGNSISADDIADEWIHESFTTYFEGLFVEYTQNYENACLYMEGLQKRISNSEPLVGKRGVNYHTTTDIYAKGANFLHTLRHVIANDTLWFSILKGLYQTHQRSIINTQIVESYFNKVSGKDLSPYFEQYLYHAQVPIFEYSLTETSSNTFLLKYRLKADVANFTLPLKVGFGNKNYITLPTSSQWQEINIGKTTASEFRVATELFYVISQQIN